MTTRSPTVPRRPLTLACLPYPSASLSTDDDEGDDEGDDAPWAALRARGDTPRRPVVSLHQGPEGSAWLHHNGSGDAVAILEDLLAAFRASANSSLEAPPAMPDDDDDDDGDARPHPQPLPSGVDRPARHDHARAVAAALEAFDRGDLEKVVLARRRRRRVPGGLHPQHGLALLVALAAAEPTGIVWGRLSGDGPAHLDDVVGCTPEHLLVRHGDTLALDTLAGSAPREEGRASAVAAPTTSPVAHTSDAHGGDVPHQGTTHPLLRSAKDRHEHQVVKDMILTSLTRALGPRLRRLEAPDVPGIKRLGRLDHLHTPVTAWLHPDGDGQHLDAVGTLVRALHPTPAVGGTPRDAALAFQAIHEGFDRGLYAGVVWARLPDVDLAVVALRGAHLHHDTIDIYAGGGLVTGSVPDTEWRELDVKCSGVEAAWAAVLQGTRASVGPSNTGPRASVGPSNTGPRASAGPTDTGARASVGPSNTGARASVGPPLAHTDDASGRALPRPQTTPPSTPPADERSAP